MSSSVNKDHVFKNPNDFNIKPVSKQTNGYNSQIFQEIKYINNVILRVVESVGVSDVELAFFIKNFNKYHKENFIAVFKPVHIINWCNKFSNNKDLMNLLLKNLIRLNGCKDMAPWLDVLSYLPDSSLLSLEYSNFHPKFLERLLGILKEQPNRSQDFLTSFAIKFSNLDEKYITQFYNNNKALLRILSSNDEDLVVELVSQIMRIYKIGECLAILDKGIIGCITENELDYSTDVVAILVNKFPKALALDSFIESETGEILVYFNEDVRYLPNFKKIIQEEFITKNQMLRLVEEYFDEDSIEYSYLMNLTHNIDQMKSEFINIIDLSDHELLPKVFINYIIDSQDRLDVFFRLIENKPYIIKKFYGDMASESVSNESSRKAFAKLLELTDNRFSGSNIINQLSKVIQDSVSSSFRSAEKQRNSICFKGKNI